MKIHKKQVRKQCKICGKKKYDISTKGHCTKCGKNLHLSAIYQIKTKQGPIYEKWKKRIQDALEKL